MDFLDRLDRFASYERSGGAWDLSPLTAIRRLLKDLGHPERGFEVVHVAGTHGKGLTAAMIEAILRSEGRRTGLYTSPYVLDVREEIQIDGAWIDGAELDRLAERVLEVATHPTASQNRPSRFDLMTALAFLAFAESGVEIAIVETGLGGRLDSTNVTDKTLAVLTPIDYDHMAILGDSLGEIIAHKLGIVRPGTPVVLAPQSPEATRVLREQLEHEHSASRVVSSPPLGISTTPPDHLELTWPDGQVHTVPCDPRFPQTAHLDCVRTALTAASVLCPVSNPDAWARAALGVSLPGRLTYRENTVLENTGPFSTVVLDGGHTPAALRACARQLDDWGLTGYTLILGLSRDRLTPGLRDPLAALCRPAEDLVLTPFESPRSTTPSDLEAWLQGTDCLAPVHLSPVYLAPVYLANSSGDALARAAQTPERPLVIAGSLYLIREVLNLDSEQRARFL